MVKVLYIEDDSDISGSIKKILEKLHEVTLVQRSEEALEILKQGKTFDVIISDNSLGKANMTGAQFAKRIHEDGIRTPLIMYSGDSWDKIRVHNGLTQTTPEKGQPIAAYVDKTDLDSIKKLKALIKHFTDREKGTIAIA